MKPQNKKPLTTKRKLLIFIAPILIMGVVLVIINRVITKEPTWKYALSFQNNQLLVSVDKTYKQYKNSKEDFFLIHIYDFKTHAYKDKITVPIQEGMDHQSELLGYSDRYIWLTTPSLTAVDMFSPDHQILDFNALKKRICAKNRQQFKDVIELAKVESYLKATNQEGDAFFVNIETFAATQTPPEPFYDFYHKDFTILGELRQYINGNSYPGNIESVATVGSIDYILKPIDETNPLKRSFFSSPNTGPQKITVTVNDSTQAAIQNGAIITTVPQTPAVQKEETRLTGLSFIHAEGLGICNNQFVFRYQKTVISTSPWYLAWFDLKTKTITKEINLESKGLKLELPSDYLKHWVSIDGKWAFFAIENKVPVRIRL